MMVKTRGADVAADAAAAYIGASRTGGQTFDRAAFGDSGGRLTVRVIRVSLTTSPSLFLAAQLK